MKYAPYGESASRRYDAAGTGMVRVQDHNTFRTMKLRSGVPLARGDEIFFDDLNGIAQNIVKSDKRRSRTLLYRS